MEEEYLAPTEISFSTPFRNNYGHVENGNETFDAHRSFNANNEDDLSFLDNFQHLNLSEKKGTLAPLSGDGELREYRTAKLNSTFDMGVAESKDNVQEEIPSFVNFGDAPSPNSPNTHLDQTLLIPNSTPPRLNHNHSAEVNGTFSQSPKVSLEADIVFTRSPKASPEINFRSPKPSLDTDIVFSRSPKSPAEVNIANHRLSNASTEEGIGTCTPGNLVLSSNSSQPKDVYSRSPKTLQTFPLSPNTSPEVLASVENNNVPQLSPNTPPKTFSALPPLPTTPGYKCSPEPALIGSKTPHPELKRLQDKLLQQERKFNVELAKHDEILKLKEEELNEIYRQIDGLREKGKPGNLKKIEAKIAALTVEKEKLDSVLLNAEAANVDVIEEREQYYSDLRNVENAYADLMGKYQRAMECMTNYRVHQDELRNRDQECTEKIMKKDQKYVALKNQVEESIETMYHELDNKFKEKKHENENLRVRLMRLEMRVDTLENDLEQKTRENAQLHTLCDEIINGQVPS